MEGRGEASRFDSPQEKESCFNLTEVSSRRIETLTQYCYRKTLFPVLSLDFFLNKKKCRYIHFTVIRNHHLKNSYIFMRNQAIVSFISPWSRKKPHKFILSPSEPQKLLIIRRKVQKNQHHINHRPLNKRRRKITRYGLINLSRKTENADST